MSGPSDEPETVEWEPDERRQRHERRADRRCVQRRDGDVGRRRADDRARTRRQVLRRLPGPEGHQPQGGDQGGGRRDRAVGVGQVDDDPLRQPARGARRGADRGRRHRAVQRHSQHHRDPPRDRHGVPELQPVPPPQRARQHHPRSTQGAQAAQGEGRGARDGDARPGEDPRAGPQVSGPAVGRPAATGGDRPRVGDATEGDAVRRTDLGARPRDDQRGARHDEGPRRRRHDDGRRHPRDGLRPRGRRPCRVHGGRPDRRGRHARALLHRPPGRADPPLPLPDPLRASRPHPNF